MSESLRDKLRRLRREDGARAPASEAPSKPHDAPSDGAAETPDAAPLVPRLDTLAASLARRGERLGKHLERRAEVRALRGADATRDERSRHANATPNAMPNGAASPASSALDVPTTSGVPNALERCARSGVLARTTALAREHAHGAWRLDAALAADANTLALLAKDDALGSLDLRDALFLDTETTGLSGGAGTYVFLVGLGAFTERGFEVWQGFLEDPAAERALLAETAERIARAPLLVTFFGKSFDRHRLEDKMRLHGVTPPFAKKPHLDLYHPLRRLYGKALPDGRLKTMERALCGVRRPNDLPGSFAPAAWFDFLAQRPHRLEGVFAHNHDDVLSLVTLAAHAGRPHGERADGGPLEDEPALRALGLARLHEERHEHEVALRLLAPFRATHAPERSARGGLARALELVGVALEVETGRIAEARLGLDGLRAGGLDADTASVHLRVLRAERRAGRAPPAHELDELERFTETCTVGAVRARLSLALRALGTGGRRGSDRGPASRGSSAR
ncbi:MAG: ribonuclease H-like domain-containing protein [Planctomycetota bacterium]